jgi:ferredoxin
MEKIIKLENLLFDWLFDDYEMDRQDIAFLSDQIYDLMTEGEVPYGTEGRCVSCKYCEDACGDGYVCNSKERYEEWLETNKKRNGYLISILGLMKDLMVSIVDFMNMMGDLYG